MDIKRRCYNRYFIEWIRTHCSEADYIDILMDYDTTDEESVNDTQDYVLEEGINGMAPACYDEFIDHVYRDKEYIKTILTESEYQEYLKIVR